MLPVLGSGFESRSRLKILGLKYVAFSWGLHYGFVSDLSVSYLPSISKDWISRFMSNVHESTGLGPQTCAVCRLLMMLIFIQDPMVKRKLKLMQSFCFKVAWSSPHFCDGWLCQEDDCKKFLWAWWTYFVWAVVFVYVCMHILGYRAWVLLTLGVLKSSVNQILLEVIIGETFCIISTKISGHNCACQSLAHICIAFRW